MQIWSLKQFFKKKTASLRDFAQSLLSRKQGSYQFPNGQVYFQVLGQGEVKPASFFFFQRSLAQPLQLDVMFGSHSTTFHFCARS